LTTVSHTLQVDHSLSKDAFREGIPESGASAVPAGGTSGDFAGGLKVHKTPLLLNFIGLLRTA
jgi:hypothetical protein